MFIYTTDSAIIPCHICSGVFMKHVRFFDDRCRKGAFLTLIRQQRCHLRTNKRSLLRNQSHENVYLRTHVHNIRSTRINKCFILSHSKIVHGSVNFFFLSLSFNLSSKTIITVYTTLLCFQKRYARKAPKINYTRRVAQFRYVFGDNGKSDQINKMSNSL